MLKLALVATVAVLVSSPATAEDNSPASAYAACNPLERITIICDMKVNAAARRRAKVRAEAMRLVGEGKCDEALELVIDTNDLDTAAKIKALCTPSAVTGSAAGSAADH